MSDCATAECQHDLAGLSHGERLLVGTIRRMVVRRGVCALVVRDFVAACGDDTTEVVATFRAFVAVLGHAARRKISVGHPGCCGLTRDEHQILGMVAAAQARDGSRLAALACWFARQDAQGPTMLATRALATAFAAHALFIEVDRPAMPAARPIRRQLQAV